MNIASGKISDECVTWLQQTCLKKSDRFLSKTEACPTASYATSNFEKRACFLNMNMFLSSRSNFLAKKHKLLHMLDRDMKFSPRKSARARKKIGYIVRTLRSVYFSIRMYTFLYKVTPYVFLLASEHAAAAARSARLSRKLALMRFFYAT